MRQTVLQNDTIGFLNYYLGLDLDSSYGLQASYYAHISTAIIHVKNSFALNGYDWDLWNVVVIRTADTYTSLSDDWFLVVSDNELYASKCTSRCSYSKILNGYLGQSIKTLKPSQYKHTWYREAFLGSVVYKTASSVVVYNDTVTDSTIDTSNELAGDFNISITGNSGIITTFNTYIGEASILLPQRAWGAIDRLIKSNIDSPLITVTLLR